MTNILSAVHSVVWGIPTLCAILIIGLWLSAANGFPQLVFLPRAIWLFLQSLHPSRPAEGSVTPFHALCTALSATIGIGNIIGVAGAICIGGPGAIMWMWLCGFIGMGIKYAEASLAVTYRTQDGGGPMYLLRDGLNLPIAASLYCLFGIAACFGMGSSVQVSSVLTACQTMFRNWGRGEDLLFGILTAVLVFGVLRGGIPSIIRLSGILVPLISAGYLLMCLTVILLHISVLPGIFAEIFKGAFSPKAITGGTVGSLFTVIRTGCSRGIFSNEAGIGTAAIAHALSGTNQPAEQGMFGMMEVLLDTGIVCTLTALAILCSGISVPFGSDLGADVTIRAFKFALGPIGALLLTGFLAAFSFATILGWSLYGQSCVRYLFGASAVRRFPLFLSAAVLAGALFRFDTVWLISDLFNGLMIIPNLIALVLLCPKLILITEKYKQSRFTHIGGLYANFHQRKPL